MKKIIAFLLLLTLSLTACQNSQPSDNKEPTVEETESTGEQETEDKASTDTGEAEGVIKVGTSALFVDILENVKEDFKARSGMEMEVIMFDDYVLPNTALSEGAIDATFHQHLPYMEAYNESNGTNLATYGDKGLVTYPYIIFSGKIKSLDELKDGDTVAIANDASNAAVALRMLAENDLIKIDETADLPSVFDITENPLNLDIKQVGPGPQVVTAKNDVTIGAIGAHTYFIGGEDPREALAVSSSEISNQNAIRLVVMPEDLDAEWAPKLVEAITSDESFEFIAEHYKGALIPVE